MKSIIRALSLAVALAAFGGSAAQAQQTTEVRMATLAPSALLWLHAIAKDQGFYAERHITVKELRAGSSPALLQAVSSGSVEAGISLGDIVIRAVDQGAPIVISGAVLEKTRFSASSAARVSIRSSNSKARQSPPVPSKAVRRICFAFNSSAAELIRAA